MNARVETKTFHLPSLVRVSFSTMIVASQPYHATSLDYGFDIDDDELARELSTPLPTSLADQPIQTVEADEFDRLYRWFNS